MLKKCTALWREARLEVKCVKNWGVRSSFGSWDDEKVHGVVARSTFRSQNVQNTPWSDHFWKLRCRKSARRCGAKHISKSKCTKHHMFAPLLEVQMSFRVAGARDCAPLQKWAKREGFGAFSPTTTTTPHYTPIHYATLQLQLHCTFTTFYYTTLHYTALNYTQLHSITLHYTTVHYATLHYTTLHYTTLHYITLHYLPLHYITLHYITLHYIPEHYNYNYTKLHYTTLHYTTFHYTPDYTTLHYTTLHYIEWHCATDRQVDR